jgi:hypothetical protein
MKDDGVEVFNRSGTSVKGVENSPLREVKAIKISGLGIYNQFWRYECFICRPSYSTVSEDAYIEPRVVKVFTFVIRHSNHSDLMLHSR